jgi:hypothetical protein
MICRRCQGMMAEDQFFDVEGIHGFMWMKGWRCMKCGHAADPLREANHRLHGATVLVDRLRSRRRRTRLWTFGPKQSHGPHAEGLRSIRTDTKKSHPSTDSQERLLRWRRF